MQRAFSFYVFAVGFSVASECNTYNFPAIGAIPDNNKTFSTRTINIPQTNATVEDINFSIDIEHTFMADIEMQIVNPQGTIVTLMKETCGKKLKVNFDDSGLVLNCDLQSTQNALPKTPLNVLNGLNPSNTWTLKYRDTSGGDIGTINAASITVCTKTYTALATNKLNINDFVLYPNPNNGQFNIQFSSDSVNDVRVLVHDLLGKKVYENSYKKTATIFNENVNIKNLSKGVYLLSIIDGDKKAEKKISIE